ncbi:MAG TPA: DUF2961 domain-containing protein [Candidatus Aminicenantes bacterium]|nr:DUF2961 domain-containing protein [Candidatus Aminicenantes bacterium]HRY66352.1 DUF2961 domain-containing protein [Candidatus Aminicenantes bacterium]HRZ72601.1 DUF2961 domain-containing protein [Candidatus Aminicenantes bacterium]
MKHGRDRSALTTTIGRAPLALLILACLALAACCGKESPRSPQMGGRLGDLIKPQQGRSRRATSAMRQGEIRRGPDGNRETGPRRYDPTADFKGDSEVQSNWDNFNVPPGATHVLLDAKGPGLITHIWMTFLGPEPHRWAPRGSATHQEMLLRIFWDGDSKPAVEAPVGDFFANCFGQRREVISLPIVVEDGDSYNSYWQMPFRKSARIEIENQSDKPLSMLYFTIDWIELDELPADTPYFHAQYRQEYPAVNGRDYVVLETAGKGHYVGTVLAVRMRSPAWFGEGDEKIYIDGETKPSIWGTGTEDYFLSAWGLKTAGTPTFGVPFFDNRGVGGHTSAYRWHVSDPIVFNTGIKVTLEHMGWMSPDENPKYESNSWNEREDDYSSVAYWYQTGPSTFAARAPDAAARRLAGLDRFVASARVLDEAKKLGRGEAPAASGGREREDLLFYRPARQAGAWLEIPFEVKAREPLHLVVKGAGIPDGGRYQATLNGVKIGEPIDFYADADQPVEQEFQLLDFWPDPGSYKLRLQCLGKSERSTGLACAVESVRLLERRPRVAAFGHDKDKDWRTDPLLYR